MGILVFWVFTCVSLITIMAAADEHEDPDLLKMSSGRKSYSSTLARKNNNTTTENEVENSSKSFTLNSVKNNEHKDKQQNLSLIDIKNINYSKSDIIFSNENHTVSTSYRNFSGLGFGTLVRGSLVILPRGRANSKLDTNGDMEFKLTKAETSPYSVAIIINPEKEDIGICTGTLITSQWVFTSAYCFKEHNKPEIYLYAGGDSIKDWKVDTHPENSQTLKAVDYFSHPNFKVYPNNSFRTVFDYSLVKAEKDFQLSKYVKPIKISLNPWTLNESMSCIMTVFGKVQMKKDNPADYLRKYLTLKVNSPCNCFEEDRDSGMWMCAEPEKGNGVCLGDIGAGLVCDEELRAVATIMLPATDFKSCDLRLPEFECGSKNTLNVFTNVCNVLKWINSHVHLFKEDLMPEKCGVVKTIPIHKNYSNTNNGLDFFSLKVFLMLSLIRIYGFYF